MRRSDRLERLAADGATTKCHGPRTAPPSPKTHFHTTHRTQPSNWAVKQAGWRPPQTKWPRFPSLGPPGGCARAPRGVHVAADALYRSAVRFGATCRHDRPPCDWNLPGPPPCASLQRPGRRTCGWRPRQRGRQAVGALVVPRARRRQRQRRWKRQQRRQHPAACAWPSTRAGGSRPAQQQQQQHGSSQPHPPGLAPATPGMCTREPGICALARAPTRSSGCRQGDVRRQEEASCCTREGS